MSWVMNDATDGDTEDTDDTYDTYNDVIGGVD